MTPYEQQAVIELGRRYVEEDGDIHQAFLGVGPDGREALIVRAKRNSQQARALTAESPVPVIIEIQEEEAHIMRLEDATLDPFVVRDAIANWQKCHNEPIPGGVQIQPGGVSWLGTGGVCFSFIPKGSTDRRFGMLTNFHVAVVGNGKVGHPQYQPAVGSKVFGVLADWEPVRPGVTNYIDAAVIDCLIDGKHTVGREIYGAGGAVAKTYKNATVGTRAAKSGRTTGYRTGRCVGIGATARVSYGNFTATLVGQDVYRADSGDFSAAGDSGSCIFDPDTLEPLSLLFAGGGRDTIGCPMRFVVERFQGSFNF